MKKQTIILAAVIIAAAVFIFFGTDIYTDLYNNSVDKGLWQELSATISEDKVSGVYLLSKGQVQLSGYEKNSFIKNLQNADFYKSNWRHEGPTGTIIIVIYKDGSKLSLQYWGDTHFETAYKGSQFLISSSGLAQTMKKHNALP